MHEDAIPILNKSLQIMPNYVPSLADLLVSLIMSIKKKGSDALTNESLENVVLLFSRLKKLSPNHPQLSNFDVSIQKLLKFLSAKKPN